METKNIFPARIDLLRVMLDWIYARIERMEFDAGTLRKVELAAEEALVNIIRHAYQGQPENIEIEIRLFPKSHVEISIRDNGPPFNPLTIRAPDLASSLEEREIGGLGIHFIKKNMDEVRYSRLDNANQLILVKNATHPSQIM
jgi:anti-sigma regulatory factor (Ser/Thr protein kinase)